MSECRREAGRQAGGEQAADPAHRGLRLVFPGHPGKSSRQAAEGRQAGGRLVERYGETQVAGGPAEPVRSEVRVVPPENYGKM